MRVTWMIVTVAGVTAIGPALTAVKRNLIHLETLKDPHQAIHASTGLEAVWEIRRALDDHEWMLAEQRYAVLSADDRDLVNMLILRRAAAEARRGDRVTCAGVLDLLVHLQPPDKDLWYAMGMLYEAVGSPDRALTVYEHGLRAETSMLSAGRFLIGMLRYRQKKWPEVIVVFSPVKDVDDASLTRVVSERFPQKATWQQALLVLGEAYEKTNVRERACRVYEQVVMLKKGSEPWIVNRGLVALATIHAQQHDASAALRAAVMAAESCYHLPLSYKRQYSLATCRSIGALLSELVPSRSADVAAVSRRLTTLFPRRAAAWYVEAQSDLVLCRPNEAAHAFQEARTLSGANAATLIPPWEILGVPGCNR